MGEAGRARMERVFTVERHVAGMFDLYERAATRRCSRTGGAPVLGGGGGARPRLELASHAATSGCSGAIASEVRAADSARRPSPRSCRQRLQMLNSAAMPGHRRAGWPPGRVANPDGRESVGLPAGGMAGLGRPRPAQEPGRFGVPAILEGQPPSRRSAGPSSGAARARVKRRGRGTRLGGAAPPAVAMASARPWSTAPRFTCHAARGTPRPRHRRATATATASGDQAARRGTRHIPARHGQR